MERLSKEDQAVWIAAGEATASALLYLARLLIAAPAKIRKLFVHSTPQPGT